MCTLLLYREPLPGVGLAVAANRDELYSRATGDFGTLCGDPLVVGGRDPEQGGTWLAVNTAGFVVAVTNARLRARRGKDQRSRGLLARDLALMSSWEAAVAHLEAEELARYAPVNVVLADRHAFVVACNLPRPHTTTVEGDSLGVGNLPVLTPDRRVERLLELGSVREDEDPLAWGRRLEKLLARHAEPTACHHDALGGTVSGTVMLLGSSLGASYVRHVSGPPCRKPWRRVSVPGSRPGRTGARR